MDMLEQEFQSSVNIMEQTVEDLEREISDLKARRRRENIFPL